MRERVHRRGASRRAPPLPPSFFPTPSSAIARPVHAPCVGFPWLPPPSAGRENRRRDAPTTSTNGRASHTLPLRRSPVRNCNVKSSSSSRTKRRRDGDKQSTLFTIDNAKVSGEGGGGAGEKARVSSPDTPTVGFSKRTALNGHERVFRSSVPAHAYIYIYTHVTAIYIYMCNYPRLTREKQHSSSGVTQSVIGDDVTTNN
ncbi:hypothetical protein ALC56_11991 [Trachymyrmex septentrionalis]|uniref:Uncharacterized protein n=1 Tax=Trachymyrmex septentrionalis TaxID=34720 RepID=A0A195EZT2_9HYME|nr:hypothetical protein ALC56_11991 [Trachymyrmex septentrionalis]